MGVHQETVDTYLENLFIESLDSASAIQAKEQVREYAMKIDEISQKWYIFCWRRADMPEATVGDLVSSFLIPYVHREAVRQQSILF